MRYHLMKRNYLIRLFLNARGAIIGFVNVRTLRQPPQNGFVNRVITATAAGTTMNSAILLASRITINDIEETARTRRDGIGSIQIHDRWLHVIYYKRTNQYVYKYGRLSITRKGADMLLDKA